MSAEVLTFRREANEPDTWVLADDDADDKLAPARGILTGLLLGLLSYAPLLLLWR